MSTALVSITDTAIKRHAADSVAVLHDQQLRPLCFRYHSSRTSGTWYLVGRQFRSRWLKIGRWPEVPAAAIRKEAHKLLVVGADTSLASSKTLGEVLTWYRARASGNTTITEERRAAVDGIIQKHLLPREALMAMPIDSIRKHDLDDHLMLPIQHVLKPATINKVFRVLKLATKTAHKLDVIGHDPLAGYRFGDFMNARLDPKPSALRTEDTVTVLEQIHKATEHLPKAALLAWLMLLHGTRISETRLTTWRDFDLTDRWWYIPARNTKTRRALRLPLTPMACQLIEQQRPENPGSKPVFIGYNGEPISRQQATNLVRQISQGQWSAHDLRKLARTVWADIGIDYMIGELLLNHTPSKLDRVYIHTYADKKTRQALEEYHHWLRTVSENTLPSGRHAEEQTKEQRTENP